MSLFHSHSHPLALRFSSTSSVSVLKKCGANLMTSSNTNSLCLELEDTKERIKKMFDQIELSVSSYDTAWVAMVPSPNSPQNPCFPSCLKWLLDNQLSDGSWASHHDPLLTKDNLSSTLACILALRQWGVGEEQITKGLKFIESNFASVSDENQHMPVGFDIIFSGMIEYAHDLNLNLPLRSTDIDAIFHRRDLELASCHRESSKGKEAYLAYVSEGIGKRQEWEIVMKYQRKNGSLFNSPSTTAAALTHLQNDGCFYYLNELLEKFGNAVPTLYPFHLYPRLCMVEAIESMGIGDHFRKEITNVLDETYRLWLKGEEEIFLDPATCALAFRILRVNGYDVSSAQLTEVAEEHFFNSLGGYLKDVGAALELYRASEMIISPDELVLKKQNSCISHFLKQELTNSSLSPDKLRKHIFPKVKNALEFPHYASLDRLVHRRNIENYCVDNLRMLKTSYRSSSFGNKDFLSLAVEGFNACQSLYHEEIKQLERWVQEKRLDKLKFARQKLAYCYFSAAATIVSPELSDARISWAKNGVLTTVVDDFFDVGGSEDELLNLIQLVEKYDVDFSINNCCSEQVEIIFSALHSTISEIGEKAIEWQGRSVTFHVTEIWLDLLRSMLQEAYWLKNKSVPTVDEYMSNGYVSFALGPIILPALYFVGPHLSEAIVRSPEYNLLYKLVSTCGRLLNDIHSFKRESMEGKLNAVSLHMIHSKSDVTEDVNKEMRRIIEEGRRELLRLVVQEKGSVVPRACKEFFWKMCKVLHLFYIKDDGFTSHDMFDVVNAVIYEPVHRNLHEL